MPAVIRAMRPSDADSVLRIQDEGIKTGLASFSGTAGDWESFNREKCPRPRLVIEHDGEIAGWAALSPVSPRRCYAGVGEVSIYISPAFFRRGLGKKLLDALFPAAEEAGFWTLQATITADNVASIALHERCGFRIVGRRERIGRVVRGPNPGWRDTILMERRSRRIFAGD